MGALEPNMGNFQAHIMYSEPHMPKKVWSPTEYIVVVVILTKYVTYIHNIFTYVG